LGSCEATFPIPTIDACPVCGFSGLNRPAYDAHGFGSLENCPSCGFQFGGTDLRQGWSHRDWRTIWIDEGTPWRSTSEKPPRHWNPQNQLGRLRHDTFSR